MSYATDMATFNSDMTALANSIRSKSGTSGPNTLAELKNAVDGIQSSGLPSLQNKTVTSNGTVTADSGYDGLGTVTVNVPQGIPIEVSTDAGMTAVLTSANVGKAYKFTGTTGTYTNGDIYVVEAN